MAESEEELKSFLIKGEKETEKVGLKVNFKKWRSCIWFHHFKTNRWGNSGNSGRLYFICLQEGNGDPFQCSCRENPRDSRAWWAAVYGPRLKQLSSRKIAADGDCSHETKRCLLLERKVMTSLNSVLKSRDITLLTKVCLVKVWFFQ